jgi:hypothetical protein
LTASAAALLLAHQFAHAAATTAQATQPESRVASYARLDAARRAVQLDPDMGSTRTVKQLHWRSDDVPREEASSLQGFLRWWSALLGWIAAGARAVVICAAVILLGLLGVVVWRLWRQHHPLEPTERSTLPAFVRGLDIRPDALPSDVPGTARELWNRGEQRAALVLLYRGLLSRLVHENRVAIRDSSTEGDCLRLSSSCLSGAKLGYVSELIQLWQRAMYASLWPRDEQFLAVCAGFDAALTAAATGATTGPAVAAI